MLPGRTVGGIVASNQRTGAAVGTKVEGSPVGLYVGGGVGFCVAAGHGPLALGCGLWAKGLGSWPGAWAVGRGEWGVGSRPWAVGHRC